MPIVIQAMDQAYITLEQKKQHITTDSFTELSVMDKHKVAEQLLSFKCVSPSSVPVPGHNTNIEKSGKHGDSSESDSVISGRKQNSKLVKKSDSKNKMDNSRSCGRLLPKHAVAILKEWILSPEHFSFPYPTEEEKKMLMKKTGISSKQIKYWFINARRRLWKQKLAEQQQSQSSIIPKVTNQTNSTHNNAVNAPNPLLGFNIDMGVPQRYQFVHPNMSSLLTLTQQQQQQTATTAFLNQQILLQQITAANAATSQMASTAFVNSALQQHRHVPNNADNFVNVFLSNLLNRQV